VKPALSIGKDRRVSDHSLASYDAVACQRFDKPSVPCAFAPPWYLSSMGSKG